MKPIPPHLPPKSCSVPLYRRLMLSSSLIVITSIALASGIVGGIIAHVYVAPEVTGGTVSYPGVSQQQKPTFDEASPLFVRDQLRRTVTLVPRTEYEKTKTIPLTGTVQAVLLTDTGWFVAYRSIPVSERDWVAVTMTGESYDISNLFFDTTHTMLYGALSAEGLRVAPFPFVSALDRGASVWAQEQGSLSQSEIEIRESVASESGHYLGQTLFSFGTKDSFEPGTILWTGDGAFVGFVTDSHTILPWYVIESSYITVFGGELPAPRVLPIIGHNVRLTEQQSTLAGGGQYGLYVDEVDAAAGENFAIIPGDIIVEISGSNFVPWTAEGSIAAHGGDTITLTRIHAGDRDDISVPLITR